MTQILSSMDYYAAPSLLYLCVFESAAQPLNLYIKKVNKKKKGKKKRERGKRYLMTFSVPSEPGLRCQFHNFEAA